MQLKGFSIHISRLATAQALRKFIAMATLCFFFFSETKSQVNLHAWYLHNWTSKDIHSPGGDSIKLTWMNNIPEGVNPKVFVIRYACKGYKIMYPVFMIKQPLIAEKPVIISKAVVPEHIPLLSVKGNILYDVVYRSRIDTPYAENDIYQHTLQTRLDFVYKGQYPFKVYLTTRFSNSPLFQKYTNLDFQYTRSEFTRLLKNRILAAAESYLFSRTRVLDSLRRLIELKKTELLSLNRAIEKPNLSQKLVEEREKELVVPAEGKSNSDTILNVGDYKSHILQQENLKIYLKHVVDSFAVKKNKVDDKELAHYNAEKERIDKDKRKIDSLVTRLEQLEKMYKSLSSSQATNQHEWRKEIEQARDANELSQTLHQLQLPDSLLPKGYKTLFAVQSLNIGRSVANYSELTVKNVSVTGLQAEFNPRYYYAIAVGKVDYRFRDYIVPNQQQSNQYLAMIRVGKGMRNGNHVIFSYYTGRRQFYNAPVAYQNNMSIPEYNLAGLSIEGYYKINKTTFLVAEVAKSTVPYYSLDSTKKNGWMGSATNFKDRSNEAYSLQLYSYLPGTQTRLSGNIKYLGANFQSFSSFTTGASQLKWTGSLEQPFFNRKLTVVSSLQQNGFNNPYVSTTYKSSCITASFMVNLRIKKWPTISAGYYPSYQLTKMGDNNFTESRYYTMLFSSSYYYPIHNAQMSVNVVYSQFYNQASDSGFVYFNSKNLLISHSLTIKRWSLLLNLSQSVNTGYSIYTIENNDQFEVSRFLSVGAGIKWIRNSLFSDLQWGYSGNLAIRVPKLGDIQLMMDKGFIPGVNNQLVENNLGRLTYLKTF